MLSRCRVPQVALQRMRARVVDFSRAPLVLADTKISSQGPAAIVAVRADASTTVVAGGFLAAGAMAWWWSQQSPVPTLEILKKQDATTSAAIMSIFKRNEAFKKYSKSTTDLIVGRDDEDGVKLQKGINLAIDKKVLPAKIDVEKIKVIKVDGKSPEAVAREIIVALGEAPSKGCVMTLQGLSGTGKGTTVATLAEVLPKTATWSNGNIFRSLTLLAVTYSKQNGCDLKDALSPELLASFMGMLEFGQFNDKFDTKIDGLGMKYLVSEIQNTKLKEISKFIPTVAEVSQGEVINFVQGALGKMSAAGCNVLVEGREQTLNYIRTPHRFELDLSDTNLIGQRRAAQEVGGKACELLKDKPNADKKEVLAALQDALATLTGK